MKMTNFHNNKKVISIKCQALDIALKFELGYNLF